MDMDLAYANAAFIADADSYPPRWVLAARAWREEMSAAGRCRLDQPYGEAAREILDIFLPDSDSRGLLVFIHGGYWRMFDKSSWSHLAAGAVARGWTVVMPSYTLVPAARISEITGQMVRAVTFAAAKVAGPIVLTGHSAGGHLCARMLCPDAGLPAAVVARLQRVVPISPLSDLRPLMQTAMNKDLRLSEAEARSESPLLCKMPFAVPVTVWVGAEERPAFLDQARWLAEAWNQASQHIAPGRHHFDVIEELSQPDSPLINTLLTGP